jgi:hypothetical protein
MLFLVPAESKYKKILYFALYSVNFNLGSNSHLLHCQLVPRSRKCGSKHPLPHATFLNGAVGTDMCYFSIFLKKYKIQSVHIKVVKKVREAHYISSGYCNTL